MGLLVAYMFSRILIELSCLLSATCVNKQLIVNLLDVIAQNKSRLYVGFLQFASYQ